MKGRDHDQHGKRASLHHKITGLLLKYPEEVADALDAARTLGFEFEPSDEDEKV